jgi:hypothetical protein
MAERGVRLLTDRGLHARVADAAAALVRETYCTSRVVPMYEAAYRRVLASS